MNQRKAKNIRNKIYGDYSPRIRKYKTLPNGQIINVGLRREYLQAKVI